MTTPPLPASPCVKCQLVYTHDSGLLAGSRFYLSYTGSAPSGTDCTTLAGDIEAAWVNQLIATVNPDWALTGVDVLDIATTSGRSGQWSGTETGTASGTAMPAQTAMNVEFGIARRYRGGKPRMYLPPAVTEKLASDVAWTSAWADSVANDVQGFMGLIEADTVGSMGTLAHVNLSYYSGFKNVENTSGRMRAAPTYRSSALVDVVDGYFGKTLVSSQKRRRVSTTP